MTAAERLERQLARWVDAGLIDDADAERIVTFERSTPDPPTPDGGDDRRSLVAEIVGYLGAALAVVAVALIVGEHLDDLTDWAQVTLSALVSVGLLVAGVTVRRRPTPAAQRLVGVLWAGAVAATSFTSGLLTSGPFGLPEEEQVVVWGLVGTLLALPLHRAHPRMPQHLALAVSITTAGTGLAVLPSIPLDATWGGLLMWAAGVAWVLLASAGALPPARTGTVVGLLAAGTGAQITTFEGSAALGLSLALGSAAVLVGLSLVARSTLLLGFGVTAAFVFVPQLVVEVFGDSLGAPLTLLVTGLILVIGAVGLNQVREQVVEDDEAAEEVART